ncbi:undecaprenyldiphospho-muramoylpentapeptide beta-N-acetylglucosaminyltransferase [Opitutaceae bacterium]
MAHRFLEFLPFAPFSAFDPPSSDFTLKTFLISCGGTGGHLSPGIALAEGLRARGHRVTLFISHKKIDARLIEKYPELSFVRIPGAPFGLHPATFVRFVWHQTHAFFFSLRQVRMLKPAGIVGFGGFTTASLMVAGALKGIPVALHEANRVPGRAIRLLGRLARRVYLPPGIDLPQARSGAVRAAGLPVRREIVRREREAACATLGLDSQRPVLAVLGGSQGASALNDWARRNAEPLARAGIQLYCVTGPGKGDEGAQAYAGPGGMSVKAIFVSFSDRMADILSAADLVVSRAGAGTIAELIRCHTPAVLVPFPQAADNHQAANAAWLAREGGGTVVDQANIAALDREVPLWMNDAARRAASQARLRQLDQADPLTFMLDDLETLTAGRSSNGSGPSIAPAKAGVVS